MEWKFVVLWRRLSLWPTGVYHFVILWPNEMNWKISAEINDYKRSVGGGGSLPVEHPFVHSSHLFSVTGRSRDDVWGAVTPTLGAQSDRCGCCHRRKTHTHTHTRTHLWLCVTFVGASNLAPTSTDTINAERKGQKASAKCGSIAGSAWLEVVGHLRRTVREVHG